MNANENKQTETKQNEQPSWWQVVGHILTWPYRVTAEYVDTAPSASMIREHVARHEVVVIPGETGVASALRLSGTDVVKFSKDEHLFRSTDPKVIDGYVTGLKCGFSLGSEAVRTLRRSEFRADSRVLKEVAHDIKKAAKEHTKAEQHQRKSEEYQASADEIAGAGDALPA
jgi:hypothetical protein